jgi:hypothetical protein
MSEDPLKNGTPSECPLGAPEVTYRSHVRVAREWLFASLVAFAGGGLAISEGAKVGNEDSLLDVMLAAGLLVAGVIGLTHGLIFRARLSVYENGVLVETIWAKVFTRWDDIQAIFESDPPNDDRDIFGMERYCCGFSQVEGRTFWFHINRMSNLRDFATRLHRGIDDRVRANALRTLAAGGEVWFGDVGISRAGVHSRKGVLPWSEVSFAGCLHDTHFEVLKKGSNWGWFSTNIREVENVAILSELIKSRKEWALPG